MSRICLIFLLSLPLTGCERDARSGARIAEDSKGHWLWMCTARVTGPTQASIVLTGQGSHTKKGVALSLALASGCRSASNHGDCLQSRQGYERIEEACTSRKPTDNTSLLQCTITLRQPETIPSQVSQGDGATQVSACRRAVVTACRMIGGGVGCTRAEKGWSQTTTIARRRPFNASSP